MISEGVIEGVEIIDKEIPICDACIRAKHSRKPYLQESKTPPCTCYGERVHSDVWGPAPVKSMGGKSFYYSFIDDYTDEAILHFMSAKSETFDRYKTYELWAKVQRRAPNIKELQTDRGGEYTSDVFNWHLEAAGTIRRLVVHDSSPQNGKAERLNRTLVEHMRAILLDASLPKFLWTEALHHAAWLRNQTTIVNSPGLTPYEKATGQKPDLLNLRRFGETA
jgi:transposase InsO family protein